jgi:16S rRNA (guanine966-N2)-methyltransferase
MRITGGDMRGRRYHTPRGRSIRPTPELVREALFNILPPVTGSTFLDLFAGSGIVGMEAMSRGAASATFIERDGRVAMAIRENLLKCGWEQHCDVLVLSVERGIHFIEASSKTYEIVFCDPPYEHGWVIRTLQTLSESSVIAERGLLAVQHSVREDIAERDAGNFVLHDRHVYGDTIITILGRENL